MPRANGDNNKPVKRRSRNGCHNCKRLKIKCDEVKPSCSNCTRSGSYCDYSLKLSWGGRATSKRTSQDEGNITFSQFQNTFVPAPQPKRGAQDFIIEYDPSTHPSKKNRRNDTTNDNSPASSTPASIEIHNFGPDIFNRNIQPSVGRIEPLDSNDDDSSHDTKMVIKNNSDSDLLFAENSAFANDLAAIDSLLADESPSYHGALSQVPIRFTNTNTYVTSPSSSTSSTPNSPTSNRVPRALLPLPDILLEVPYYMELFNHFVHITADVLVPVPRQLYPDNPFATVLPQIALGTPHLLSVMLAYAASHRAKWLNREEPTEVISQLLNRTFEGLNRSLEDSRESKSDATLATAIMLATYEIISAKVDDSWKTHLHGAREIVVARGLADRLSGGLLTDSTDSGSSSGRNESSRMFGPHQLKLLNEWISEDEASYFLLRSFSYIDVIGSLSSSSASTSLTTNEPVAQLWSIPTNTRLSHDSGIDFLLGLDLNMIPIFSKVSSLIHRRRTLSEKSETDHIVEEEEEIASEALELSQILLTCCSNDSMKMVAPTRRAFSSASCSYTQLRVMNLAFCYAALIHLYRRALLFPGQSDTVQSIVSTVTDLLETHIPAGSHIEACMSFPIFTVGCEVYDHPTREVYRGRINGMKRFGIGQITRASEVMELCWESGRPWTEIVDEMGWDLNLL